MSSKRFEVTYSQGTFDTVRILVDTETGVHYMSTTQGNAGGLTPLLGPDGKPIVTEIDRVSQLDL